MGSHTPGYQGDIGSIFSEFSYFRLKSYLVKYKTYYNDRI